MILKIKLNNKKVKNGIKTSTIVVIDHTKSIKSGNSVKLGSLICPPRGIKTLFIDRKSLLYYIANGVEFTEAARKILSSELKLIIQNKEKNVITKPIK